MLRRLSLTALIALLLLGAAALAEGAPQGYELACQNSRFNIYLKRDTLAIIIESKESGKLLYSTVQNPDAMKDNAAWKGFYQSGVVMEYIEDVKSVNTQADFINNASEITYEFAENGFSAHVLFPDIGISYDMELSMDERGFSVFIPQSSIRETMSDKYTAAAFYVFPFLGHSYLGQDEGYLIIPDGQGAIIRLKDNEGRYTSPFNRPTYGLKVGIEDTVYSSWNVEAEPIILPAFGIVHTADQIGFLGFIEEGDIGANIMAYPNGVRMGFDWVCAKYTYRWVYAQPTGPSSGTVSMRTEHPRTFDIRQHFLLCDGEEATYAGLAVACRELLEEKGYFSSAEGRAFDIEVDFLGLERENYVLGTREVVMTSFDEARDILDALKAQGVDRLTAVYRGWIENGLTGGTPTDRYAPAGSLGGRRGLESLFDQVRALGYGVALEADFLTLNTRTHPTLLFSAFKKMTSQTFAFPTFGMVYDTLHYLTPSKSLEIARNTLRQFRDNGVPGVSLVEMTRFMTDYYEKNQYQDVSAMRDTYAEIARMAEETSSSTLTAANAYLWRYANALSAMPISGSDYTYTDREIPLLAIATSGKIPYYAGYVNFEANTRRFFLRLIEQGARPRFLITFKDPIELQNTNSGSIYSSKFELYEEMIVSWYEELSAFHEAVGASSISRHDTQGDIARVTWESGARVYINFGEKTGEMDGVMLDKLSYKVVNAHGE